MKLSHNKNKKLVIVLVIGMILGNVSAAPIRVIAEPQDLKASVQNDDEQVQVSTDEQLIENAESTELVADTEQEEVTKETDKIEVVVSEEKSVEESAKYVKESPIVKELAIQIDQMTLDDVLVDFGGRVYAGTLNQKLHVPVPAENANVDRYQLDESFQELQNHSIEFIVEVLNQFSEYNAIPEEEISVGIQNELKELILLKVYFDRWYGIEINGVNLADQMYFKQSSNKDILDIAEKIRKKPAILNSDVTGLRYRETLQPYYGYSDVPTLVEAFVQEQTQSTDYDAWFQQYFKGDIYEAQSKYKEMIVSTWDKVKNNLNRTQSTNESKDGTDNLVLPLLTVKHSEGLVLGNAPGIIIYSSKKQYGSNVNQVMNQTVENFKNYFDTLFDTQTEVKKKEMLERIKTIPIYDSDRYEYNVDGKSGMYFNYLDETNILSNEFYLAIGLTNNLGSVTNASAGPQGITFRIAQINNGSGGTLAHEYSHSISHILLGTDIDLSNYGYRKSQNIEAIASRINNSPDYWEGMPWVIYESSNYSNHAKDPLANSADRFQKPEDLQGYFGGYTSLVNIMNQVVADVVLEMPIKEQVGYIRQWNADTQVFKTLTEAEIAGLNLVNMDDLVDNNMVIVDKSVSDGEPGYNDYGEVFYTRYSLYYAESRGEPVNSLSDSIELFDTLMSLPQYMGWDAVQQFYSSSTGAQTDIEALRLVTQDPEMDFVKFKKMKLHENEERVKKSGLKDHSYDDLVTLFKTNPTNFEKVKLDIYKQYMADTSEFRTTIFSDKEDTTTTKPLDPSNPEMDKPITPENPNGTVGPLSIDYVSQFHFGEQGITSKDKTYNVSLDKVKDFEGNVIERPTFVQVTDTRGTNSGWRLQVQQEGQFSTKVYKEEVELKGAVISMKNLTNKSTTDNLATAPTVASKITLVPGTSTTSGALQEVMSAGVGEGMLTWINSFGTEVTGKESVSLFVPGVSSKVKDATYTTKLTWVLSDAPV